jgi:microcystin degradation protein MlrC
MASFVKRMQSFEGQDGVLSVSLGHGFPWGDVADNGSRLWVVTDNDLAAAQTLADQLGREFYDMREATRSHPLGVDAALDQAMALSRDPGGPVVLADIADNAGGGAPADSTFILQRVMQRGIGNAVLGPFWDLGAVQICRDAGVGAAIDLRVGGKCGPVSGWPVDLRVTVRAIALNHSQDVFGMRWPLGPSVWVETLDGVSLLLTSVRSQAYGTDAFTGLGLTLHDKTLVVVKSTQHFYAKFAPLAKAVFYVDTPGAITQDFANIAFKVRPLNYWPRVDDPWAFET